jgi:hypothetical protein
MSANATRLATDGLSEMQAYGVLVVIVSPSEFGLA